MTLTLNLILLVSLNSCQEGTDVSLKLKFKHKYFAYSQLVVFTSSYFLLNIMKYIIDGICIFRKRVAS